MLWQCDDIFEEDRFSDIGGPAAHFFAPVCFAEVILSAGRVCLLREMHIFVGGFAQVQLQSPLLG